MLTGLGYAFLEGGGRKASIIRSSSAFLYKRAFKRSDGVIFHNRDDYEHLKSFGVIPPTLPVHIAGGSGIEPNFFFARPYEGVAIVSAQDIAVPDIDDAAQQWFFRFQQQDLPTHRNDA